MVAENRVLLQHHRFPRSRCKLQSLSVRRAILTSSVFHPTTRRHRISHRKITQHFRRVRRQHAHPEIIRYPTRDVPEYVTSRPRRYPYRIRTPLRRRQIRLTQISVTGIIYDRTLFHVIRMRHKRHVLKHDNIHRPYAHTRRPRTATK